MPKRRATPSLPAASGALRAAVRAEIARFTAARAPPSTFCPSEVARAMRRSEAEWRALMPLVRAEAAAMIGEGADLEATQRGVPLRALLDAVGPIRLRAKAARATAPAPPAAGTRSGLPSGR